MLDIKAIEKAAELIKKGKIVAVPSDAVYGLAADATSDSAVKKIYRIKGRSPNNPLTINVPNVKMLQKMAHLGAKAEKLIAAFWPGSLTIVLPIKASAKLSKWLLAGRPTLGVRIPSHPIIIELMKYLDTLIISTSANVSGRPSPLNAAMVREQIGDKIDFVLDGGPTSLQEHSTIIDLSQDMPILVREGPVKIEEIERIIGKVAI